MALIIEDGSGVNGADSFVTSAQYIEFMADWFGEIVTADDPALRRAFGYMRTLNWVDDAFPTFGGTVPGAVLDAQCVFARAEVAAKGALAPTVTAGQQKVLVGVDSMRWQVTGSSGVDAQRATVTAATDMLKGLLRDTGNVTWLERA